MFVLVALLVGTTPLSGGGADTYLSSDVLVSYWTTITWTSVLVGSAGGLLLVTNRRVLTTGVVIALALVPSLALAVLELGAGEPALAGSALLRWLLDVVLVLVGCSAVFAVKRRTDKRVMSGAPTSTE